MKKSWLAHIRQIFDVILNAFGEVFENYFDSEINHVMSKEARRIFAYKPDRDKYMEASEKAHKKRKPQTIITETCGEITLYVNY